MKIERFEEIKAWQEARTLVNMVYDAVKADKGFGSDYRFRDQIQSAAVSIMSNIAEGFSRRRTKEFVQFLFIAKGSAAELQSQLYVALDQGYISRERFSDLYSKSDEVGRMLSGFIQYLLKLDQTPVTPATQQTQSTLRTLGTQETQQTLETQVTQQTGPVQGTGG